MMVNANPLRVLVVDDEPAILRFLRAGLSAQGFTVSEAQTGRSALDEMALGATDLTVLDLGLPDMDGLDVIREVRAKGVPIPIIVLSSRDDEGSKVAALDLGADDFVTKPFGIDELFARIRAAQRHRLQQVGERPVFRSRDLVVDLPRPTLHARIDARLAAMVACGVLDEVAALGARRLAADAPAMRAIGTAPLLAAARGEISLVAALAATALATRHYAKRQSTWFRNQTPDWPRHLTNVHG